MGMASRHVNQAEAPIEQMAYPFRAQPQTLEQAARAYRIQGVIPTIKGLHSTDDSARNHNLDLPVGQCGDDPATGRWGNRYSRAYDLWRAVY